MCLQYIQTCVIRMVQEVDNDFTCFMGEGFGSSMPGLPSWVRDFSQTRPLQVVVVKERRSRYVTLYQASFMHPTRPLWNESKELYHRGAYADTTKAVGHPSYLTDTLLRDIFSQWLTLCKEVLRAIRTSSPTHNILSNNMRRCV